MFIMPVELIETFYIKCLSMKNWLPEVIAFGGQFYLRKAFLAGCADYLKNPWDIEEYLLRTGRILDRLEESYTFTRGTLRFFPGECGIEGHRAGLTPQELKILKLLLRHRGEAVPRDVLLQMLQGPGGDKSSRAVDMHVSHLRKKLFFLGEDKLIVAARKEGYLIPLPPE